MNETAPEKQETYSRFSMPPVRHVDPSTGHERGEHEETGVCKLAPFLHRGASPWPFKYSIGGTECH